MDALIKWRRRLFEGIVPQEVEDMIFEAAGPLTCWLCRDLSRMEGNVSKELATAIWTDAMTQAHRRFEDLEALETQPDVQALCSVTDKSYFRFLLSEWPARWEDIMQIAIRNVWMDEIEAESAGHEDQFQPWRQLCMAVQHGHVESIQALRSRDFAAFEDLCSVCVRKPFPQDRNGLPLEGNPAVESLIYVAAFYGCLPSLELLLELWPEERVGAIYYAAIGGQVHIMQWLSVRHPLIFHESDFRYHDLAIVGRRGHLNAIEWIFEHNPEVFNTSALYMVTCEAIIGNHLHILRWWHEKNLSGLTGRAMETAVAHGRLEIVRWLLENRPQCHSSHAFIIAAQLNFIDIIKLLLPFESDQAIDAAMDAAQKYDRLEAMQVLSMAKELKHRH